MRHSDYFDCESDAVSEGATLDSQFASDTRTSVRQNPWLRASRGLIDATAVIAAVLGIAPTDTASANPGDKGKWVRRGRKLLLASGASATIAGAFVGAAALPSAAGPGDWGITGDGQQKTTPEKNKTDDKPAASSNSGDTKTPAKTPQDSTGDHHPPGGPKAPDQIAPPAPAETLDSVINAINADKAPGVQAPPTDWDRLRDDDAALRTAHLFAGDSQLAMGGKQPEPSLADDVVGWFVGNADASSEMPPQANAELSGAKAINPDGSYFQADGDLDKLFSPDDSLLGVSSTQGNLTHHYDAEGKPENETEYFTSSVTLTDPTGETYIKNAFFGDLKHTQPGAETKLVETSVTAGNQNGGRQSVGDSRFEGPNDPDTLADTGFDGNPGADAAEATASPYEKDQRTSNETSTALELPEVQLAEPIEVTDTEVVGLASDRAGMTAAEQPRTQHDTDATQLAAAETNSRLVSRANPPAASLNPVVTERPTWFENDIEHDFEETFLLQNAPRDHDNDKARAASQNSKGSGDANANTLTDSQLETLGFAVEADFKPTEPPAADTTAGEAAKEAAPDVQLARIDEPATTEKATAEPTEFEVIEVDTFEIGRSHIEEDVDHATESSFDFEDARAARAFSSNQLAMLADLVGLDLTDISALNGETPGHFDANRGVAALGRLSPAEAARFDGYINNSGHFFETRSMPNGNVNGVTHAIPGAISVGRVLITTHYSEGSTRDPDDVAATAVHEAAHYEQHLLGMPITHLDIMGRQVALLAELKGPADTPIWVRNMLSTVRYSIDNGGYTTYEDLKALKGSDEMLKSELASQVLRYFPEASSEEGKQAIAELKGMIIDPNILDSELQPFFENDGLPIHRNANIDGSVTVPTEGGEFNVRRRYDGRLAITNHDTKTNTTIERIAVNGEIVHAVTTDLNANIVTNTFTNSYGVTRKDVIDLDNYKMDSTFSIDDVELDVTLDWSGKITGVRIDGLESLPSRIRSWLDGDESIASRVQSWIDSSRL